MIRVTELTKFYDSGKEKRPAAVSNVGFQNETGSFLTLLGPSGCGKSTTLRCIAGLETPDDGEIQIGQKIVYSKSRRINLSPADRRIGMVFQSYAIWPHMTVLQNVAYPLRFESLSAKERKEKALTVLDIVDLGELSDRPAPHLSGGQQQRVALARALVAQPEVLLLDEPLSNLDATLRRELGIYIRRLQKELNLTVIYVTHDQSEAMSMSDRVALMDKGQIVEEGDPLSMYHLPKSQFTASFLGEANYFAVKGFSQKGELVIVDTPEGEISLSREGLSSPRVLQDDPLGYLLMVRPEDISVRESNTSLADEGPSPNSLCGTIEARHYFGFMSEYAIRTYGGHVMRVRSVVRQDLPTGLRVRLSFQAESCVLVTRSPSQSSVPELAADRPNSLEGAVAQNPPVSSETETARLLAMGGKSDREA